jgi:hypothetical protein
MENLEQQNAIKREINRLSIRVAILRYELREAILQETPLAFLRDTMQEICILQEQICLLKMERFKELPYNIQQLYL